MKLAQTGPFLDRVGALPRLGIGVSTEYGAGAGAAEGKALDVDRLVREHPTRAAFLEIGVEVDKGLDAHATRWIEAGRPCTYHFLDVNLDDDRDLDDTEWVASVNALIAKMQPAWLCGDAGWWHFGHRDRAQMLLLPPLLVDENATEIARGVAKLRERTGLDVLPENPPGTAYVGELHILEFFRRVIERADTGMLLDVAHLAMFQRLRGHDALHGLDAFPLERIIEVHVAGGEERTSAEGFQFVEDAHGTAVLDDTWRIFEHVAKHAKNLCAVVFECERNANEALDHGFAKLESSWR